MNQTPPTIHLSKIIPEEYSGQRLDQVAHQIFPEFSRARLQQWIRAHQLLLNNAPYRPRDKVRGGEIITIDATLPPKEDWSAEDMPLAIVFEDESLLVINKPAGMVVHPAIGNLQHTLINALVHHYPGLAGLPRAGIVHRLDKDTSGLLVVAKDLQAHHSLVQQLQARSMKREYCAIVNGVVLAGGTIDAPIGRHRLVRTKMAVTRAGRPAVTHYRIIERFRSHTYLRIFLETGRTHQIRVHLAHVRHPIVGDQSYNPRSQVPTTASANLKAALSQFKRQALHAKGLQLVHPKSQAAMHWTAPVPADMQALLEALRQNNPLC
jgi:23S rRNA pseudouridine1911/1915/1917 synthase